MIALLGIDCVTDPRKTGIALGELHNGVVRILHCTTGSRRLTPSSIVIDWLKDYDEALIALDAPLGWPRALGNCLTVHKAGLPIKAKADELFRRATDIEMRERLGKLPLEVGANLIAITAVAALDLLDQIRQLTGRSIPLAWQQEETERWRAIEVYNAATRIGHGASDVGGSLVGLEGLVDYSAVQPEVMQSKDAVDAVVCSLGAADFLLGRAIGPLNHETSVLEGWIWAPDIRKVRSQ